MPPTPTGPPPQSSSPPAPLQSPSLTEDDLKNPSTINTILQNLTQMVNYTLGHAGTPVFKSGADFNGQPVGNVGAPQSPADVVTALFADENYGAQALLPQFEALGKSTLQTYRQLNNPIQRESSSSFLNDLESTGPTSNTATLTSNVSGGTVDVNVSSGLHQYMDNSSVPFATRTDTFNLPSGFTISSLVRSGNVVTATLASPFIGAPGIFIGVYNTGDPGFQGVGFEVLTVAGNIITYAQAGPNTSTSGGTLSVVNTYYYTRTRQQNQLGLVAAGGDTWSARVQPSKDGTTLIAVVIVNSNGMDAVNSAAGLTPPPTGASIPVIRRL